MSLGPFGPFRSVQKVSRECSRSGDLLCGRFWRWMLLVCQLFTHDSHDLKADVPILAVKTKQKAHIFSYAPVSALISGRQMVWRNLQCFSVDANNFTRLNNTQCFHVFRSQARMTLTTSNVPKKRNNCCERFALARRQTDKKHTPATNAHQFRPKHAI